MREDRFDGPRPSTKEERAKSLQAIEEGKEQVDEEKHEVGAMVAPGSTDVRENSSREYKTMEFLDPVLQESLDKAEEAAESDRLYALKNGTRPKSKSYKIVEGQDAGREYARRNSFSNHSFGKEVFNPTGTSATREFDDEFDLVGDEEIPDNMLAYAVTLSLKPDSISKSQEELTYDDFDVTDASVRGRNKVRKEFVNSIIKREAERIRDESNPRAKGEGAGRKVSFFGEEHPTKGVLPVENIKFSVVRPPMDLKNFLLGIEAGAKLRELSTEKDVPTEVILPKPRDSTMVNLEGCFIRFATELKLSGFCLKEILPPGSEEPNISESRASLQAFLDGLDQGLKGGKTSVSTERSYMAPTPVSEEKPKLKSALKKTGAEGRGLGGGGEGRGR